MIAKIIQRYGMVIKTHEFQLIFKKMVCLLNPYATFRQIRELWAGVEINPTNRKDLKFQKEE
jgi:hypothetical protein